MGTLGIWAALACGGSVRARPERTVSLEKVAQLGGPSLAVAARGDTAYLGIGNVLVVAAMASDGSGSLELRRLGQTAALADEIQNVVVAGDHAYAAALAGGLLVIDVADPARPALAGAITAGGVASDVRVAGGYAYVADGYGLAVVDVRQPAAPRVAGRVSTGGSAVAVDFEPSRSLAVIAAFDAGLRVIDVADPARPREVGALVPSPVTSGVSVEALDVVVVGRYAYLATNADNGLRVVDLDNPARPVQVAALTSVSGASLAATSSRLYVTDAAVFRQSPGARGAPGGQLTVINIVRPTVPSLEVLLPTRRSLVNLAVAGNRVLTVTGEPGMQAFEVQSADRVALVGELDLAHDAHEIALGHGAAYVAAGFNGLQVIDVAETTRLREAHAVGAPLDGAADDDVLEAWAVAVAGDHAYVADWRRGLRVLSLADPLDPRPVGQADTDGLALDVDVAGGHAFVAASGAGLAILDVGDPAAPRPVATVDLPSRAYAVEVAGGYAYVALDNTGVRVIDVRDPAHPRAVAAQDVEGAQGDMALVGDRLYLAVAVIAGLGTDFSTQLWAIDVSDPTRLRPLGVSLIAMSPANLFAVGDLVYLTGYQLSSSGDPVAVVHVLDVSAPDTAAALASVRLPGHPLAVAADSRHVYAAEGPGGFTVFAIGGDALPPSPSVTPTDPPPSRTPSPSPSATTRPSPSPSATPNATPHPLFLPATYQTWP